jgi:hypothetical protein
MSEEILHLDKTNTNEYQFTVSVEGISLAEISARFCILLDNNHGVYYNCSSTTTGVFNCKIPKTSIFKSDEYDCILEILTSNGLIFKPLKTKIKVVDTDANVEVKAVIGKKPIPATPKDTTKVDSTEKNTESKKSKDVDDSTASNSQTEKREESVADIKLQQIIAEMGIKSVKVDKTAIKAKIPSLKSKMH